MKRTQKKITLNIKDSLLASTLHEVLNLEYQLVSDIDDFDICLSDTGTETDNTIILSMPIRLGEVFDEIQSKLALLNTKNTGHDINLGSFSFSPNIGILKYKNKQIALTEKETDMLLYLYKQRGKVVQRQEILEHVWKYNSDINTRTLETHIYRLRQKILDISGVNTLISTEERGYKLSI